MVTALPKRKYEMLINCKNHFENKFDYIQTKRILPNTRSISFTNSIFLFETPSFVFNFLFNSIIKWNSDKKSKSKKYRYKQIWKNISENNYLKQSLLSKGPTNKCGNITYNNSKKKQSHNILSNQYINISENRTKNFKIHNGVLNWVMGLGASYASNVTSSAFNYFYNISKH